MGKILVEVRCMHCGFYYEAQYTPAAAQNAGNLYGTCTKCMEANAQTNGGYD